MSEAIRQSSGTGEGAKRYRSFLSSGTSTDTGSGTSTAISTSGTIYPSLSLSLILEINLEREMALQLDRLKMHRRFFHSYSFFQSFLLVNITC